MKLFFKFLPFCGKNHLEIVLKTNLLSCVQNHIENAQFESFTKIWPTFLHSKVKLLHKLFRISLLKSENSIPKNNQPQQHGPKKSNIFTKCLHENLTKHFTEMHHATDLHNLIWNGNISNEQQLHILYFYVSTVSIYPDQKENIQNINKVGIIQVAKTNPK